MSNQRSQSIARAARLRAPDATVSASAQQHPLDELALCRRWQIFGDIGARDRLLAAYDDDVRVMARSFGSYGVDEADLVQEGVLGLLTALSRFQPGRGPLDRCVVYWIRLRMIVFVSRGLGPCKLDSAALRRYARQDVVTTLAGALDHAAASRSDPEAGCASRADPAPNAEQQLVSAAEATERRAWLQRALESLSEAQRDVVRARHLCDEPAELETIAARMGASREAVRRIEAGALAQIFASRQSGALIGDVLVGGRRVRVPRPSRRMVMTKGATR